MSRGRVHGVRWVVRRPRGGRYATDRLCSTRDGASLRFGSRHGRAGYVAGYGRHQSANGLADIRTNAYARGQPLAALEVAGPYVRCPECACDDCEAREAAVLQQMDERVASLARDVRAAAHTPGPNHAVPPTTICACPLSTGPLTTRAFSGLVHCPRTCSLSALTATATVHSHVSACARACGGGGRAI